MGAGVRGENCGDVTRHTRCRLEVHTILQYDGGKGLPGILMGAICRQFLYNPMASSCVETNFEVITKLFHFHFFCL